MAAEEKTKRVRRDKKTVLQEKISGIDEKINSLQSKIATLEAEKTKLQKEMEEIGNEALKKAKIEEQKKMASLLKKKNISLEELEQLLADK